jgi:large subunit ribosomal protein L25
MSHKTPSVPAEQRERVGTRYAQRLRKAGRLPAVVYGHKQDPVSVSVDGKSMLQHLEHGNRVFELAIEGGVTETVLVRDLQFGFMGDNVVHIDFARVNLNEEVTVNIPLHFVGTPKEAMKSGAIVQTDHVEIPLTTTVANIPEQIRVDLSEMEGTTLTAGEITLPSGCVLAEDPGTSIISISIVAEEAEGEEVELGGDDAPKVIGDGDGEEG